MQTTRQFKGARRSHEYNIQIVYKLELYGLKTTRILLVQITLSCFYYLASILHLQHT